MGMSAELEVYPLTLCLLQVIGLMVKEDGVEVRGER